jgi:hypothetical protein
LANVLEESAAETTVETNMKASAAEPKVETQVAKKGPSTRNRAFNIKACAAETKVETNVNFAKRSKAQEATLFLIAVVLLAWFAMRPRHGGLAAFPGSVR